MDLLVQYHCWPLGNIGFSDAMVFCEVTFYFKKKSQEMQFVSVNLALLFNKYVPTRINNGHFRHLLTADQFRDIAGSSFTPRITSC